LESLQSANLPQDGVTLATAMASVARLGWRLVILAEWRGSEDGVVPSDRWTIDNPEIQRVK